MPGSVFKIVVDGDIGDGILHPSKYEAAVYSYITGLFCIDSVASCAGEYCHHYI